MVHEYSTFRHFRLKYPGFASNARTGREIGRVCEEEENRKVEVQPPGAMLTISGHGQALISDLIGLLVSCLNVSWAFLIQCIFRNKKRGSYLA